MKFQGTPEEIEQAKVWWEEQTKRVDKKYKKDKLEKGKNEILKCKNYTESLKTLGIFLF